MRQKPNFRKIPNQVISSSEVAQGTKAVPLRSQGMQEGMQETLKEAAQLQVLRGQSWVVLTQFTPTLPPTTTGTARDHGGSGREETEYKRPSDSQHAASEQAPAGVRPRDHPDRATRRDIRHLPVFQAARSRMRRERRRWAAPANLQNQVFPAPV